MPFSGAKNKGQNDVAPSPVVLESSREQTGAAELKRRTTQLPLTGLASGRGGLGKSPKSDDLHIRATSRHCPPHLFILVASILNLGTARKHATTRGSGTRARAPVPPLAPPL